VAVDTPRTRVCVPVCAPVCLHASASAGECVHTHTHTHANRNGEGSVDPPQHRHLPPLAAAPSERDRRTSWGGPSAHRCSTGHLWCASDTCRYAQPPQVSTLPPLGPQPPSRCRSLCLCLCRCRCRCRCHCLISLSSAPPACLSRLTTGVVHLRGQSVPVAAGEHRIGVTH
jgi:hypothetical protein